MRRMVLLMGVVAVMAGVVMMAGCGGGGTSGGKPEEAAPSLPAGEIVFTRSLKSGGRPSLYVMKPDGSQVRLFMRDAAGAAVSPDGSRIAFCRDHSIWIVRRDGAAVRQLTRPLSKDTSVAPDTSDCDPEWSADGRSIFFSRFASKTYTSSIYSVSAEGGPVRRVGFAVCPAEPSPSPDGRLIAYADTGLECGRGVQYIAMMTTKGREASMPFRVPDTYVEIYDDERVQVGDEWYVQSGPAWSPDGRRLAFNVSGLGNTTKDGIWVASAGGSPPRRVARGSAFAPSWSPNGKWIVFGCSDISLVRADGTGRHKLVTTPAIECAPVWLPPAR